MGSADRTGRSVRVSFSHAEGLQAAGGVKGFEIAGKDGTFVPVSAVIEGNGVLLSSDAAAQATAVRYGYQNVTDANLQNRAGLPAPAFSIKLRE